MSWQPYTWGKRIFGVIATFADGFFAVVATMKRGLEWFWSNKAVIFGTIVAIAKGIYDFIVDQVNYAVAEMQDLEAIDVEVYAESVADFLAFGNCIFPIAELFAALIILFNLFLVATVIKAILRFIPFI